MYSVVFYGVDGAPQPPRAVVLGATSMIIWILTWLLVLKYTFVVLHADDNGHGAAGWPEACCVCAALLHVACAVIFSRLSQPKLCRMCTVSHAVQLTTLLRRLLRALTGPCMRAGSAFALFSLLKRQAGLGTGGRTAALDRMLTQYSTGPVRSGSGASPRAQRRNAGGQGSAQGQGQGLEEGSRPRLSAASRSSACAQHDWRQRLIAVSGPLTAGGCTQALMTLVPSPRVHAAQVILQCGSRRKLCSSRGSGCAHDNWTGDTFCPCPKTSPA